MQIILKKWPGASVQVVYYIPDYMNLVNEFIWQTEDQLPEYPRITRFLNYWDKNIFNIYLNITLASGQLSFNLLNIFSHSSAATGL